MLRFHGAWRITVVGKNASFDQRAVVRGPYGTRILPGRVGATLEVDEDSWTLTLEHHLWGRSWQPNLRVTPGPVTERDGVRSRLLTSNDCHWPDKPLDYVNFVVRLDQSLAPAPALAPVRAVRAADSLQPSAPRAIRTSSSDDVGDFGAPATRPAPASRPAPATRPTANPAPRPAQAPGTNARPAATPW
ncbi:hypothetical protein ACFVHI_28715 [Kitasatospora sp. NPDC127121]|uniref:hypothetical protein n=1 Tax=unclassified Kitasatospora TaxID=2633591 RepID=UPI0036310FE3